MIKQSISEAAAGFCRAMLYASAACRRAVSVCLCVRPSLTFVRSVKTNKHIFKIVSPPGSHTMLVFPYQTSWQYSDVNAPNQYGGVECRLNKLKSRF